MSDAAPLEAAWVPEDTFGARLALIRQRFHWNVTEAGKNTGIAPATWASWEEGSFPRKLEATAHKISTATGCSRDWLLLGGGLQAQKFSQITGPDLRLLSGGGENSIDPEGTPAPFTPRIVR